jgi:hypothetical protein
MFCRVAGSTTGSKKSKRSVKRSTSVHSVFVYGTTHGQARKIAECIAYLTSALYPASAARGVALHCAIPSRYRVAAFYDSDFRGASAYTESGFVTHCLMRLVRGRQSGDTDTSRDYVLSSAAMSY